MRLLQGLFRNKAALLLIFLLAACQSGGDGGSPGGRSGTSAPTISGSPTTTIIENSSFSFTPTARDSDGDPLSYSITNMPGWASFDTTTGMLSGTPTAANVGTTSNIVISVSDGTNTVSLPAFDLTVIAVTATGSATLSWTAPTTYTNNNPMSDLSGYEIHYGTTSGNYPNVVTVTDPLLTQYTINSLAPGTYFFVMRAVTPTARSAFTPEVSKVVTSP